MNARVRGRIVAATVAGLAFAGMAAVQPKVGDYAQDGLVMQLDALDNEGTGVHNSSATVWKDLAGNYDFTLTSNGSWGDTCFNYNGPSAIAATKLPADNLTVEIVYVSTGATKGLLLYSGQNERNVFDEYGTTLWFSTGSSSSTQTSMSFASANTTNGVAAVYASASDTLLKTAYLNGVQTNTCAHSDGWNSYTTHAIIGARTDGGECSVAGRLFAVRLYSRELTADEVLWHHALDRARFFNDRTLYDRLTPSIGIADIPDQEIIGGTTAEPTVTVTNVETGAVLAKGTDYAVSYSDNTGPGTAVAQVTGLGGYAGQSAAKTFRITRVRASSYSAASYAHDGMIVQLDGLENAGYGLHDASASVWKDLRGTYDFSLLSAAGWGENYLSFNGKSAQSGLTLPLYGTIEAVFKLDAAADGYILYTHTMDRVLFSHNSGSALWFRSCQGVSAAIPLGAYDDLHQVAATYDGSAVTAAYRDAEAVDLAATADQWNISGTAPTLGGRANGAWGTRGRIYALRLYDRQLTQDEIAYNYAVDRVRFFGDYSEFCDFTVSAIPDQLYDGSPAICPEPDVLSREDGVRLVKGTDYTLAYTNNTTPGTATVTVIGKGSRAGMYYPVNFTIKDPVFAAPAAAGTADGSAWSNAMDYASAIAAAEAGGAICLRAGEYPLVSAVTVSVPISLLGGYRGNDADAFARDDGALSVFSGNYTNATLFSVTTDTATEDGNTFERLAFDGALSHGLVKSGKAGIAFKACAFRRNGFNDTGYADGRGASLSGAANAVARFENCDFTDNMATNSASYAGNGVALCVSGFARVELVGCSFVGNGLAAGLRGGSTQTVKYGAALYATVPVVASGCEFRANHVAERNDKRGGIVYLAGGTGHVFSNCLFVANSGTFMQYGGTTGGGVVNLTLGSSARSAAFERCTFAYNLSDSISCANLNIVSGSATVRNCIFYGAQVPDSFTGAKYIFIAAGQKCTVSDTLFPSDAAGDAVKATDDYGLTVGKNVHFAEPHFVTTPETAASWTVTSGGCLYFDPAKTNALVAADVHLRHADGVYSAAIDQGAEEDDAGSEPSPNGNRLNLGAYAGTAEAATSSPDAATVADFSVSWPNDESLPKFTATLGGAAGALYNADVVFYCATGTLIEAGAWIEAGTVYGLHAGDVAELQYTLPFTPGDDCLMKAVVVNADAEVAETVSCKVGGHLPAWYGKGGGAGVLHVWANAPYDDETGADWGHAYRTMSAALAAWTSDKTEIWIAGTNTVLSGLSLKPTVPVVLRGGFTGTENAAAARPAAGVATLDGLHTATAILTLNNAAAAPVTIERLAFVRGYIRGLSKSSGGNLTLAGCRFENNGTRQCNNGGGYGALLTGAAGARAVITNCLFEGQTYGSQCQNQNNGGAINASTFDRVEIVDTSFVNNGAAPTAAVGTQSPYRNTSGRAVYLGNAPASVRRCAFVANRGCTGGPLGPVNGGTLTFVGACGGSEVKNCRFVGNSDLRCGTDGSSASEYRYGGPLVFRLSATSDAARVENCTFAWNLVDTYASPAGVSVVTGTVDIVNCLFHDNVSEATEPTGRDIAFGPGGRGSVAYTLFDDDLATAVSTNEGVTVRTATLLFGDPLLLSDQKTSDLLATSSGCTYFKLADATLATLKALDCHLRSRIGHIDGTTGALVRYRGSTASSRAIDAGDPASDWANEPGAPYGTNGKRVNLGAYGNTSEAAITPSPGTLFTVR